MLEDFNYWLALKGTSTLNHPLPWYYSAGFLNIEFWSNPAAVAAALPWVMDRDPPAQVRGNALIYYWQFT